MTFSFKAALFDLDGVLLDTESLYTDFWARQGELLNEDGETFAYKIKGMTLKQILERFFADDANARTRLINNVNEHERSMPYDYISHSIDFVKYLHSIGVKTAVVTSSNNLKMESVYRVHPDFKTFFDLILTSEDFSRSKPFPDCYLKAAELLGFDIDECAVFEDSMNGIKSGKNAGMKVFGLATTCKKEDIEGLADCVVSGFDELLERYS